MAEADVLVRAFDQTRHVANREPVEVGIFHNADLRVQRGERIRRDLRPRLGNGREQRGLARVRITDQPDLGHDAQFEKIIAFPARFARLRETRRLARRGGKIAVAQTAAPALAQHELLPVFGEVGDQFALSRFAGGKFPRVFPAQINFLRQHAARAANQWPFARAGFENRLFVLVSRPPFFLFRWAAWCRRAARRACRREL